MISRKNIEKSLKPFIQTLFKIKSQDVPNCDDGKISAMSQALKQRALGGEPERNLLPEAFALVYAAVKRTLGLTPFDVQLLAAIAMAAGRIVELPTGEGKTLVAVFTAYLGALSGKGVHVLTFNDYLAKRDALWMKPVYDLLGVTVRYVNEGMNTAERKEAYCADITYLTAKEAGFDYLRSFLVYDSSELVQRPFHLAIIDEADSILIDEARVPLVIAGNMPTQVEIEQEIFSVVSSLKAGVHFETDEYANNILLTTAGTDFIEQQLGLSNLYDPNCIDILTKINVTIQTVFLLKKDVDYIVRKEEVLLVDEFTGRIMKDRQWPDGLQAAVEMKEGLLSKPQGIILNRITLQNFLQYYPFLCGMTGTATPSSPEFGQFYGRAVTVIPPNKPCIRIDHPDYVFTHKQAKYDAVIQEIRKEHETGRPVLVGTNSVEESELLSDMLRPFLDDLAVLNAKNDAQEAEIIANAGKPYAVTISTNMAGRGVDIRLGGKDGADYAKVCALGGLYVIGTNRYESVRIDLQLRGRAGRQGDPGESRFFISLEDDLSVKYRIQDCLPEKIRDSKQSEPLYYPVINRAVVHTQKIVEGQTLDAKITLSKYSYVAEDQRKIVHKKREKILSGGECLSVLEKSDPVRVEKLLKQVSVDEFRRAQKMIELFAINQCWADHLLIIESALDEVKIISQVRDPFLYYNQKLIRGFDLFENHIREMIFEINDHLIIKDGRIDLNKMGVRGPSSTRTYMVNDGTEQLQDAGGITFAANPMFYMFYLLFAYILKHGKGKNKI